MYDISLIHETNISQKVLMCSSEIQYANTTIWILVIEISDEGILSRNFISLILKVYRSVPGILNLNNSTIGWNIKFK